MATQQVVEIDGIPVSLGHLLGISTKPNANNFSERVLAGLKDTIKREDANRGRGSTANSIVDLKVDGKPFWLTLDWLNEYLPGYINDPNVKIPQPKPGDSKPLQQIDLLRPFYLEIAENGLQAAYEKWSKKKAKPPPVGSVLIVGGGLSGMVAAYELTRAGYKDVQILEMSERYGGRVKTFTMKDGFNRGLHSDAGAMRIPLPPKKDRPIEESIHYLTDYYAQNRFGLDQVKFSNASDNAYYCFYGDIIQISEWNKDPKKYFDKYWQGWNSKPATKGFTTIKQYYDAVTDVVIKLLKMRLSWIKEVKKEEKWIAQAAVWTIWTQNWCQFSFGSFLRSTLEGIKSQLKYPPTDPQQKQEYYDTLDTLKPLLPWPEAAITAYSVFNYTLAEDISLVAEVQEKMGDWWQDEMHSLPGGLSALPEAFANQGDVEKLIVYNRMVTKVEVVWSEGKVKSAKVHGVYTSSGQPFCVEGRSVFLTVPLHVLRGIEIVSVSADGASPPGEMVPMDFQKSIEDITYSPSTKIMLQYEKQFWHEDAKAIIDGGFSKTNKPIGQLHYPTIRSPYISLRYDNSEIVDKAGILMVYTWKAEAMLWGAMTEDQAIMMAVNQVKEIHKGSKEFFQVGKRQAWASDPTTLGAFAMLRPREYLSVLYLMLKHWHNVFFAGEAISFANGWIQGALGSGLRAAFQLYFRDQLGD